MDIRKKTRKIISNPVKVSKKLQQNHSVAGLSANIESEFPRTLKLIYMNTPLPQIFKQKPLKKENSFKIKTKLMSLNSKSFVNPKSNQSFLNITESHANNDTAIFGSRTYLGTKSKTTSQSLTSLIHKNDFLVPGSFFFCISHSHGPSGHEVISLINSSLLSCIEQSYSNSNPNFPLKKKIELAYLRGYEKLEILLEVSSIDIRLSGSTSISVFIKDNLLVCSNIGDMHGIIAKINNSKIAAININKEHILTDFDERKRIEESNGIVDYAKGTR